MAQNDTTFFLYYPLHLIHGPSESPQRFLDLFPERNLTAPAASYGTYLLRPTLLYK
jgi:hypothetical protein